MNDRQAQQILDELRRANRWSIGQWTCQIIMILLLLLIGAKLIQGAETASLPSDAAVAALTDVKTLPANRALFTRYLWVEDNAPLYLSAIDLSLNMLGHDVNFFTTYRTGGGLLLRLDLRQMAGPGARSNEEFVAVRDAWESIVDPSFHIQESVEISVVNVDVEVRVGREVIAEVSAGTPIETTGRRETSGETEFLEVVVDGKKGFVATSAVQQKIEQLRFGLGSFAEALDQLAAITQSRAPIVHAPHFLGVAMVAADPGIGHEPLYYRFLDWNGLSLQQLFDRYKVRVGDILDFESAAWAVTGNSQVTDKPRGMTLVVVPTIRPTVAPPYWYLSLDFDDEHEATDDPFLNLLSPRPVATEIVATKPNGTYAYAVANIEYDDKKLSFLEAVRDNKITSNLVGEVDPRIATDHELQPKPATSRLIPGISCANCHGFEGAEGLKKFDSEILTLLKYRFGPNLRPGFTGDETGTDGVDDALKKIAGRYYLDPEPTLALARVAHKEVVARISAQPGKPDGYLPSELYAEMARIYRDYVYGKVGRAQALKECAGIVLEEGENAGEWFNAIWPPLPPNRLNARPEHANITRLRAGLVLPRKAFNLVKPDLLLRGAQQVAEFRKLKAIPPMPEDKPEENPEMESKEPANADS